MGEAKLFDRSILFVAAAAAAVSAIEGIAIYFVSLPYLITHFLADDLFYYLSLARNASRGLGPVYDGSELTNGFHPLYFLFLRGVYGVVGENLEAIVRIALVTLLLIVNGTAIVIAAGFSSQGRRDVGTASALLWLVNPWIACIALEGVEVPMATFFLAITLFLYLKIRCADPRSYSQIALLGGVMGMAVLARTDSVLFMAALCAVEAVGFWKSGRRPFVTAMEGMLFVAAFTAVTAPWWWWNLSNFGSIVQVSAEAQRFRNQPIDPTLFSYARGLFDQFSGFIARFVTFTFPAIIVFVWCVAVSSDRRSAVFRTAARLDFVLLTAGLLLAWYAGWMWHFQSWYFLSSILFITIIAGYAAYELPVVESRRVFSAAFRFLAPLALCLWVLVCIIPRHAPQGRALEIVRWLNDHTEKDAVIGAWNSGIIGYFTERRVINLDGVVNNSLHRFQVVARARSIDALMPYIRGRGIRYVADYELPELRTYKGDSLTPLSTAADGSSVFRVKQ